MTENLSNADQAVVAIAAALALKHIEAIPRGSKTVSEYFAVIEHLKAPANPNPEAPTLASYFKVTLPQFGIELNSPTFEAIEILTVQALVDFTAQEDFNDRVKVIEAVPDKGFIWHLPRYLMAVVAQQAIRNAAAVQGVEII